MSVIAEALNTAGARVLANQHQRVQVHGEKLVIVGMDDAGRGGPNQRAHFRGITREDCTIVLAHNPDTALYTRHLNQASCYAATLMAGWCEFRFTAR